MAGERRAATEIDWQGMEGDRRYAFIRRGNGTRFPWLTGRDLSALVLYRPSYADPERPRTSPVIVRTPAGRDLALGEAELGHELAAAAGMPVDLLQLGTGAHDLMPVSIMTTASLARLEERHGGRVDRRRFRANIVVESASSELDWRDRRLRFGVDGHGAELLLAYPAPRCAMVTIDPDDGTRDARVLRTVARDFAGAFTMYASVAKPGTVREGDDVRVM